MLRTVALALFAAALAAACGGNSSLDDADDSGDVGEMSAGESSGGASVSGGTSGAAGTGAGGTTSGGVSGASGDGGATAGGAMTGGRETGGSDTGGANQGGTNQGGTNQGGAGGAQGGDAGLGGAGARGGASGSTSGGAAGATTTDPNCPVREPAQASECPGPGLVCPYDASGCRCLLVQSDRCFQLDTTCFATNAADRIAPPPAHYCSCVLAGDDAFRWSCAALQ